MITQSRRTVVIALVATIAMIPMAGSCLGATQQSKRGDDGDIAGASVVVFDNGPFITGGITPVPACAFGQFSVLQDLTMCMSTLGFNATGVPGVVEVNTVDDFSLSQCTQLDEIEMYFYQTGAATMNIVNATVRIHAGGMPASITSNVVGISTTFETPPVFTGIFRVSQSAQAYGCTRQLIRVVVDLSNIPPLPAGNYAISWIVNGGPQFSVLQPPVTFLGMYGKPGANARQTPNLSPNFTSMALDPRVTGTCGGTPAPGPVAQDLPFIIRGNPATCPVPCPANIVTSGSSATRVDVNDLLAVISSWGACAGCPPTHCPADVAPVGPPAGDCSVNVNDLLLVITTWGPCP